MSIMRMALAVIMLIPGVAGAFGIVGTGNSSEDSLAVSVHLTDSLGNPSGTHADSFFVSVIGPSGDSIVTIAGIASTSGLHIDSLQTALAGWRYVFAEAINTVDGAGRPGVYEIIFCAKDNVPDYVDCARTSFQVVDDNLNTQLAAVTTILDSILAALDTLQNQDNWVAQEATATTQYSSVMSGIVAARDTAHLAHEDAEDVHDTVNLYDTRLDSILTALADGHVTKLKDSLALQGAASGADSGLMQRISNRQLDSLQQAAITDLSDDAIDAIWDEPQAGHGLAGTYGDYLDACISGVGTPTGSGTYPVTVTAFDSSSMQVVPGVRVSVHNLSLSALVAWGMTASSGAGHFNLDTGSYIISLSAPGYVFSAYDTIIVTGSRHDSIAGYRFDPGLPSSPDLCRAYGYFYGIDGQPLAGVVVTAQLDGVVRHDSLIISPYKRSATSDSAGYFQLDLIPSADLDPGGAVYLVSATYPVGTILKKVVSVPKTTNWLLTW
jgi:hypothetical protein